MAEINELPTQGCECDICVALIKRTHNHQMADAMRILLMRIADDVGVDVRLTFITGHDKEERANVQ